MAAEKIIETRSIRARFGAAVVLDDVNLSIYRHEIVVIIGESGCGKTTLMRILIGLAKPSSGTVFLEGAPPTRHAITKKVGVLFQNNALFGSMTVGENIALPIAAYTDLDRSAIEKIIRMKLGMVGLAGFENHLPSELSGGMKKKAAMARALALSPSILFLDEPSSGLDPVSAAEIDELILHINRSSGTTMVVVTHDLASVFTLTRRVIMLGKAKKGIIAEGTPEFLKNECNDPFVKQFFNRQPRPGTTGWQTV
ncbi:MAG: ATP-binding cassette domain-containing protein [Thermodesulfobacteriota bacterium]|nr:ATP-binding cassette domain-containing protein [Thermodesulfobacteriota bacterium]